jgi:hypothetical protein
MSNASSTPSPSAPVKPSLAGLPRPGLHQRGKALFLMIFGLPFPLIGLALYFYGISQLPRAAALSEAGLALILTAFTLPFRGIGGFLVFGPLMKAAPLIAPSVTARPTARPCDRSASQASMSTRSSPPQRLNWTGEARPRRSGYNRG